VLVQKKYDRIFWNHPARRSTFTAMNEKQKISSAKTGTRKKSNPAHNAVEEFEDIIHSLENQNKVLDKIMRYLQGYNNDKSKQISK
jgi:hypothetical protein